MRTEEDRERSLVIKPDHCHSCQTAGRMALLESKEISEGLHPEVEELGVPGVLEPHGFPKAYRPMLNCRRTPRSRSVEPGGPLQSPAR